MTSTSIGASSRFNPYIYTSGRWLRHDEQERSARHIPFDFEALSRRVVDLSPGASSIRECIKKEGGFNRVFLFTTDNGQRLVAKLPFTIAGPQKLTTQSEVATMHYIQTKTEIPVPKILDWNDDIFHPVKSEYIIMEHVEGVQLAQVWSMMTGDQRIRCIGTIFQHLKQVANMTFPAYGSLYYANIPLESSCKIPLDQDYCIGPHCGAMYWGCRPSEPRYYQNVESNHGPWSDLQAYCDGLVDTGITRVPPNPDLSTYPRYQGPPTEHLALLEPGRAVMQEISKDPRVLDAAAPLLFHPDLHKRNIFVSVDDPTVVTGIIDWQSASVEPAFWFSQDVPDFATYTPEARDQSHFNQELCAKAYDGSVRLLLPKLATPRLLDESLFRPFRYCYRTWKDGAVAFRHELIETSRHWADLGLPGSCPFALPDDKDLAVHQDHYKRFVAAHDLRRDVAALLNTAPDGWVPAQDWEEACKAHKELFASMSAAVLAYEDPDNDELIKSEADLREIGRAHV